MENYLNEIAQLETRIVEVRRSRVELEQSNSLKVKQVLDGIFNPFKEYEIRVNRGSATFYMVDEDGRSREMFSISFYVKYKQDCKLELSYYTTNTQSEFELDRLIFLGGVARIIRGRSKSILKSILDVINSDVERSNELYSFQLGYEKKIAEYQKANFDRKKVEIELALRGQGVVFSSVKNMTLKRNYTTRVFEIKIVKVSASGKTCTVQYKNESQNGYEDKVNVQSLIDQVMFVHKDIVSTSELV